MFPVHYLVLVYLSTAPAGVSINYMNVYDIAYGKQIIQMPVQKPKLHSERGDEGICVTLHPEHFGESAVCLIDFRESYPIILINMTVYSEVRTMGNVTVLIDGKTCATPTLKYGTNVFTCSSYLIGRVLAVKTYSEITVCFVHVFTCPAGKRGPNCSEPCANGTYGIACRPCNCLNNDVCRTFDGLCPSGCHDVNSGKSYDCYYRSISRREEGHFASYTETDVNKIAFLPNFFYRNEIIQSTKIDSPVVEKLACTVIKCDDNSRTAVVELTYKSSIFLYSVVITYCDFDISPPYSIHIALNGNSCFGMTMYKPLALGTYTFICQRKGITGSTLIISHTSYVINSNATINIGVKSNQITVIGCARGFYGRKCKLQCNCLGSVCDPVTGYCPSRLCGTFAKGYNCAALNVAQSHRIVASANVRGPLTAGSPPGKLESLIFPPFINDQTQNSWWAIQLDGVYYIQGITLHVREEHTPNFRVFAVFMDTETRLGNYLQRRKHSWNGIGCTRDSDQHQQETAIGVKCIGPVRTITIVTDGYYPFISMAVEDVEVWTCQDGTFGPLCESVCNCRDEDEVCNRATGECFSGCADGYGGKDCQIPCATQTYKSCGKVCRCSERSRGCGPGVVLCGENKCLPGWLGVSCDIPCPQGWFGLACAEKCGPCRNGSQNESCNPTDGYCLHGCTNNLTTPTCKLGTTGYQELLKKTTEAKEIVAAYKIIIYGLVIVVVVIALICLCVRLILIKRSAMKAGGKFEQERRFLNADVSEKIIRGHRDYHEHFVQKKVLKQSSNISEPPYISPLKKLFSFGKTKQQKDKDATPKHLFGGRWDTNKGKSAADDRCKPIDDNTKQDSDQKVALWILREDFNVLISSRQEKLKTYKGDILNIKESACTVDSLNITKDELDRLYDEAGLLGIP